jgi:hypothetical protein
VGKVLNDTGERFDINIEKMLADSFAETLKKENLMASDSDQSSLTLTSRIIEYKKGDAFKRWLMPGWGSTALAIKCDLEDKGKVVGSVDAKRTVDIGGGYTIGAWKTVFSKLADDVVSDLKKQLGK